MNFLPSTIDDLLAFAYADPAQKTYHFTRLAMYKALEGALAPYEREGSTCLSVSFSEPLGRILGLKQTEYVPANYPEYSMTDLRAFESNSFDFCISDQVLEHIEGNPIKAFAESARVIKPGGYVCHTTCFINEIHGVPKDFWRFTPDALRLMAAECGLEATTVGGWGNREVHRMMQSKYRMMPIPNNPENPIYKLAHLNEEDWPIVVWIVAKRP